MNKIQTTKNISQKRWCKEECEKKFIRDYNDQTISLWIADSDLPLPDAINDVIIERAKIPHYGYTVFNPDFIKSFIEYNKTVRNQSLKFDEIIFTPGTVYSFSSALQALTDFGDEVMMSIPVYKPLHDVSLAWKRKAVLVPFLEKEFEYFFDFETIEKEMKNNNIKVFILVSPLNPGGKIWSQSELTKLVDLCKKYDVAIISDEIHCDVILTDKKFTSMLEFTNDYKKIVVLTSLNKTFNIAGMQVGWMVIKDENLRLKVREVLELNHIMIEPNIFAETAMYACMSKGVDHFRGSIKTYVEHKQLIQDELINKVDGLNLIKGDATFLAYVSFKDTNISKEEMKEIIWNKSNVLVHFGEDFVDPQSKCFRINMATTKELLLEACNRIAKEINLDIKKEKNEK